MKKVGFIGAGNMATAIISGIVKSKLNVKLMAYDKFFNDTLTTEYNVEKMESISDVVRECDYLILAVKPQNLTDITPEIKASSNNDTVIISILAGKGIDVIAGVLGNSTKIVQVMPNTPLFLGEAASALCKSKNVTDQEFDFVRNIFNSAGITAVVPKDKMNEIIAISGSTPAFIYEFAKHFIEYGKSAGLDKDVCTQLFAQTLIGSAKMITDSGKSIDELITMVSSKGGTTVAGLEALRNSGLEGIIKNACKKCVGRAYELAELD